MHLSRICIQNFRNFSDFEAALNGNVVVVGENRVGKSNLIHALRLILDPTLPDSARQLRMADFWDGLGAPGSGTNIKVAIELREFDSDLDILALLSSFRLDDDPTTARLTYEFRPKAGIEGEPASDDDYEFTCYGGEHESRTFGHALRRRLSLDVLPALRDAENDLANWRRSPLRPLVETAFAGIQKEELEAIAIAIEEATGKLAEFGEIGQLELSIGDFLTEMAGSKQNVNPRLGFAPAEAVRLYRSIQLLIDDGRRSINDASLGSANLVFLTLKAIELQAQIAQNKRDHTFLAIEEPEAHLHPHLQRSVYRHFFETLFKNKGTQTELSVLLTTHSPHVASVAPLRSLLLLKESNDDGTKGRSTAAIPLSETEVADLARYLDVTRAELLFARGVILVEGDAERFLVPVFAENLSISLDGLGISVCSVGGTNFGPYVKLLKGLGIPFSVITDWDPIDEGSHPLGYNRMLTLVSVIEQVRTGAIPSALLAELDAIADYDGFCDRCEGFGLFTNTATLEVELFEGDYVAPIVQTLREGEFGKKRSSWIDGWEKEPASLDQTNYLTLIEAIGKGRFAQRLCSRLGKLKPPRYIEAAIDFVVSHV
ncbi:ATP-dependent nuclease [Bradyrhizobium stylosanthis]|uniref:Putative ATP-dependent endonuclease of OLD family n=1 Tax=Bradyrhizobium stylosanthis TaxID=1803665 RepID=A0A560CYV6_9BRAD|nr:AAA family ATPase [Bradyrhizobium stylosanthis]TWA90049.1 putative ATP-dependent endonuclease of OLD family [Bradyrhizobium stylosanthis]